MTALQVGYEAFQNRRRRIITFICLVLASSSAMGISVYIDSYAVYEWNDLMQIGSVAIVVYGSTTRSLLNEVRVLPSVTTADWVLQRGLTLISTNGSSDWSEYVQLSALSSTLQSSFPDLLEIDVGRPPQNASEIMLHSKLADEYALSVGSRVNCTSWYPCHSSVILVVVGLFHEVVDRSDEYFSYNYYGILGGGIVHIDLPPLMSYDWYELLIVDVDRTPITPFNPYGSLLYLEGISRSIYNLRPDLSRDYYVNNRLGEAVSKYIHFVINTRVSEGLRATGIGIIIVLVLLMAIRFNFNERQYEMRLLISRGTPRDRVYAAVFREIIVLSVMSSLAGVPIGILLSRIGMATSSSSDMTLTWSAPLLVSLESIVLASVVGVAMPVATSYIYKLYSASRRLVETEHGRLARLARFLELVKWDVLVILLSALGLLYVNSTLTQIRSSLALGLLLRPVIVGAPLALVLGVSKLFTRLLRRSTDYLSRALVPVLGAVHSSIGIRRIGRAVSSVTPVTIVIVLSISLALSSVAVTESAPATKLLEARYAFGGDMRFELRKGSQMLWDDLRANITAHSEVEATALVSVSEVMLSTATYDYAYLVFLSPLEFIHVGYDHTGVQLNASYLREQILSLASEPYGALVTRDIATSYALEVGDTVRILTGMDRVLLLRIVGVPDFLPSMSAADTGTDSSWSIETLGMSTIWVNAELMNDYMSMHSDHFICARTRTGSNSTQVAQDILRHVNESVLVYDSWVTASRELDYYTGRTIFKIDRAVDSLICVCSLLTVFAAYTVYAFEGIQTRRREIALLRTLGGDSVLVSRLQATEMLILVGASLILLLIVAPFIIISVVALYHTSYYVYPTPYLLVLPWTTAAWVVGLFVAAVVVFVTCVAILSSRVRLAESLNADWTESSPFGGEM